jgi:urease accessory protein
MTQSPFSFRKLAVGALVALTPALAQAHPGHDHGDFATGVLHPLNGLDHLLAMVAIGLWAVQLGGRAVWAVPLSFVGAMSVGAAVGISGFALPGAELGILASVLVLGALLVACVRLPLAVSAALAAVVAVCHGFAHGAELPAGASALTYGLGFVAATAALHALGITAGLAARAGAQPIWIRAAGLTLVAAGGLLAIR